MFSNFAAKEKDGGYLATSDALVDLHLHTTASDGRLTPQEVLQCAEEQGLEYIAITDHDTVEGYLEVAGLTGRKVKVIAGVEFSTDLPEHEVHILGYGIDANDRKLAAYFSLLREARQKRIMKMVEKLQDLGFFLEYEDVVKTAGDAVCIGRPHVARTLVEKGYFKLSEEAFISLIGKKKPAYVPHYKLTPQEVIALIKNAGGIPVLAHPGLVGCDAIVESLIEDGIAGMEVFHPRHSEEETKRYLAMAEAKGLIISGGSDFHAIEGRYPETIGAFKIKKSWLRHFPWPK